MTSSTLQQLLVNDSQHLSADVDILAFQADHALLPHNHGKSMAVLT